MQEPKGCIDAQIHQRPGDANDHDNENREHEERWYIRHAATPCLLPTRSLQLS
jgi:hypothetical protein